VPISPARRLIVVYALLTASTIPYAALADDVDAGSSGQAVFWWVLFSLLVWRLWKGSLNAWCIAVILEVLMIAFLFLLQPSLGPTPFVLLAVSFGGLMILFSPSVRAHTRPGPGTGLASG
jgi:hypothetical protein